MNAQEVINKFISKGFQLNSDSLKFFTENPEKIDDFITELENLPQKPTTITKENVTKFLETTESEIKIIEEFPRQNKVLTTNEVAQIYQNQFDRIKKILSNRIDLPNSISINKISDKLKEFSIIARVSQIDGSKIILEDLTNQITVTFPNSESDKQFLIEGEVAGFICSNTERGLQIKKIIWPDLQFKKEVTKGTGKIMFSNTTDEKLQQSSIKIFLGNEGLFLERDSEIKKISDPCILEMNGVRIFVSHGKILEKYKAKLGDTAAKIILNLARKRIIFPPKSIAENFVLEEIPDIFVVDSFGEAEAITYKGTTFLSLGDPNKKKTAWIVDLQTRENVKIDLN